MIAQSLSINTIKERIRISNKLFEYWGIPLTDLEITHIVDWLAIAPSASSRWTYYTALKAFYRWAYFTKLLKVNTFDHIPAPKKPQSRPRPVPTEWIKEVLGGRLHKRTRLMILLAYKCGLRIHEIAKIRGQDYDSRQKVITIIGKGNQLAQVFISKDMEDLCNSMPKNGWWFPSYVCTSQALKPRSVGATIQRAFASKGYNITAHQLRHSTGTDLVKAGVNIRVVQEVLRHKSLQSTQIYTQIIDEQVKEAIETLPNFS